MTDETALVPADRGAALLRHEQHDEDVRHLLNLSRSPNTLRAYLESWKAWRSWALENAAPVLPASAEDVVRFLSWRARSAPRTDGTTGYSVSQLRRDRSAISAVHRAASLPNPCRSELVGQVLRGAAKKGGARPGKGPTDALTVGELRRMADTVQGDQPRQVRDRALLLLGFCAALRRDELAALDWSDLRLVREGLVVSIYEGKARDPDTAELVGVAHQAPAYCPVLAVEALRRAGPGEGPVFVDVATGKRLTDRSVYNRIRQAAKRAGVTARISPHSLRSGGLTRAAELGAGELALGKHGRHSDVRQTAKYVRPRELWNMNPTRGML